MRKLITTRVVDSEVHPGQPIIATFICGKQVKFSIKDIGIRKYRPFFFKDPEAKAFPWQVYSTTLWPRYDHKPGKWAIAYCSTLWRALGVATKTVTISLNCHNILV